MPRRISESFYTYVHYKPTGVPFYVGKGFGDRAYRFGVKRSQYHQNIVAKYGRKNIKIKVINTESEEAAFELEIFLIKEIRLSGYELANHTDGGEGSVGYKHSKECLVKLSEKLKGKIWSDERKKAMSEKMKGRKFTPEHLSNMSKAIKGRDIGKKASEEAKKKMSLSRTGKISSIETRKKQSIAAMGNTRGKWCAGIKHSTERKEKNRVAHLGQVPWNKGIKIGVSK